MAASQVTVRTVSKIYLIYDEFFDNKKRPPFIELCAIDLSNNQKQPETIEKAIFDSGNRISPNTDDKYFTPITRGNKDMIIVPLEFSFSKTLIENLKADFNMGLLAIKNRKYCLRFGYFPRYYTVVYEYTTFNNNKITIMIGGIGDDKENIITITEGP